jgi:hypothetical protein
MGSCLFLVDADDRADDLADEHRAAGLIDAGLGEPPPRTKAQAIPSCAWVFV